MPSLLQDSMTTARDASRPERTCWQIACESDLVTLEPEWRSLEQRAPGLTVFQTYDWCRAWVDATEAARALEIVKVLTIRSGRTAILIWPFAVCRVAGFRVLHTLGEPATQYSDVLVCPEHETTGLLVAAWKTICSWTDVDAIELRRVRKGSILDRVSPLENREVPSATDAAPYLDYGMLNGSGVAMQRSSRSRNSLRRHERHLGEYGPVRLEIVGDASEQVAACNEILRLKREWCKRRSVVSAGCVHPASDGCMMRLASSGKLVGARLRVGNKTAALELGMMARGTYWSLFQSYEHDFADHAPGRLLFWKFLETAPQLGIGLFDFLAPADQHKREWSNGQTPVMDYVVPVSARGAIVSRYLTHVKPALRDLHRRLPPSIRRTTGRLVRSLS